VRAGEYRRAEQRIDRATNLGAAFVEVYYWDATNPSDYAAITTFQSWCRAG